MSSSSTVKVDSVAPTQFRAFFERISEVLREHPDAPAFTMVDVRGQDQRGLTHREFHRAAEALAHKMEQHWDLKQGDRVFLVYPSGLDFVLAFYACLLAGAIPMPIPTPKPLSLDKDVEAFEEAAKLCEPAFVLTNNVYMKFRTLERIKKFHRPWRNSWIRLPWYATDKTRVPHASEGYRAKDRPTDTAFLQLSSGSTAQPKAIITTFANLLHHWSCVKERLNLSHDTVAVFWPPHYHDFCLISGILNNLLTGSHLYLISPMDFVRRPSVWFEVMHRARATHTATPNFGLEFALRRTTDEQRKSWDLSSLKVFMNAAEPINANTVRRFFSAFSGANLDPNTHCASYGLAEHTVGVTVGGRSVLHFDATTLQQGVAEPRDADCETATAVVSCGRPLDTVDVAIVDPETCEKLPENRVGEIWARSESKTAGYWGLPEETARTFAARLKSHEGDAFLRTGDLGFLRDGELFVAGRIKELLIVRGRNVHPYQIERHIQSLDPRIRGGGGSVFQLSNLDSDIVALIETNNAQLEEGEISELVTSIRREVTRAFGVDLNHCLFGERGLISKTTSGKLRRAHDAKQFSEGHPANRAYAKLSFPTTT